MDEKKVKETLVKIRKIIEMIEEDPTDSMAAALAELLLGNAIELRNAIR